MDLGDNRDPHGTGPSEDTSHLGVQVVTQKKSRKKLVIWLVVLLLVVVAAVAGGYFYKTEVVDKKTATEAAVKASTSPSASPKALTAEEQMTKTLTDSVKQQEDILTKNDDSVAIKKSSEAAMGVGENLHETDLKD